MTIDKNGYRVLIGDGFVPNQEQTQVIEETMECAKIFAEKMRILEKSIPDGYQHRFFGNWDILRISKIPEREGYQFE